MFAPVRVRFLLKQIFGIIWWGGPVRNAVIMHHFAVLYVSMYEDTVWFYNIVAIDLAYATSVCFNNLTYLLNENGSPVFSVQSRPSAGKLNKLDEDYSPHTGIPLNHAYDHDVAKGWSLGLSKASAICNTGFSSLTLVCAIFRLFSS